MLATMVFGFTSSDDDLFTILSTSGRPARELKTLGSQMPRGEVYAEVRTIAADAEKVLRERHRVTHSLYMSAAPERGVPDGFAIHPRKWRTQGGDQQTDPLPTPDELNDLASQIAKVGAQASEWLIRHAGFRRSARVRRCLDEGLDDPTYVIGDWRRCSVAFGLASPRLHRVLALPARPEDRPPQQGTRRLGALGLILTDPAAHGRRHIRGTSRRSPSSGTVIGDWRRCSVARPDPRQPRRSHSRTIPLLQRD